MSARLNLSTYVNKFVKIKLGKNPEVPYIHGIIIAYLKYDENCKIYILNYPYNTKTNSCDMGEAGFDPNDIESITLASDKERILWLGEYVKFVKSVINENGCDPCVLDMRIEELVPGIEIIMK